MINGSDPLVRLTFYTLPTPLIPRLMIGIGESFQKKKKKIKTDRLWERSVRSVPKEDPLFSKKRS